MAKRVARTIGHKKAIELLEQMSCQFDSDYSAKFQRRAYVLPDGRFLTEIVEDKTWYIWDSRDSWRTIMARASGTPTEIDPVSEAIGDLPRFLAERAQLARQLIQLANASEEPGGLGKTVDHVDAHVRKRSGPYWSEDRLRLRRLIAYVGEVLHEECGAAWATDPTAHGAMDMPDSTRVNVGREIVAQADEAPRGSFSIQAVLRELKSIGS